MPNVSCSKTGENLVWLDFGLKITSVPSGELSAEELDLYQFFFDSDLVWKVDHVDAYGQCWLCVQHDESRYQLLTPLEGTYRTVPCDPAYPVHVDLGRQHTTSIEAVNDGF